MRSEKKGRIAEIIPEGDLRGKLSKDFVETIRELISQDAKRFSIDLSKTGFIDSYSLSSLMIFCDSPELDFTFKNVPDQIRIFFDVLKLGKKALIEQ